MNKTIQELLESAGFVMWADEEWGPGPGNIDWSSDHTREFEKFLKLLSDRIYSKIEQQRNVDDYSESLNIEYDRAWQLGFNSGLIIAAAEANKLLTGND